MWLIFYHFGYIESNQRDIQGGKSVFSELSLIAKLNFVRILISLGQIAELLAVQRNKERLYD